MTRFGSLIVCAALGVALAACGSSTSDGTGGTGGVATGGSGPGTGGTSGTGGVAVAKGILDLVLGDNAVSGWTIDPDNAKTAGKVAATGTTEKQVEDLIDGAAADFFMEPHMPKNFAWQNYVSSTVKDAPPPLGATVVLYVMELASADQSRSLYDDLRKASLYTRKTGMPEDWQDPAPTTPPLGTDSRIQDTGDSWWINFFKGNFYVEVKLGPSAGPAPDFTPGNANTKDEAFKFARAVLDRI
jgi:hypothetical protein